nr:putative ribonuclease H-like domain-containing protein [Tanacetum cinerariifolium]
MSVVQKESIVDTSDLQPELECTKERFENCIIKKENEYAKLWNDWYKKCDECKYDKISYDKAYKDMQQKIERLQAQLGDLKGKPPMLGDIHALSKPVTSNSILTPQEAKVMKTDKQCLISVNHNVCLRNYVNGKTSRGTKQKANVSIKEKQKKHQLKVKKTKKVGFSERIATPKPSKPRFSLRWSPTGRLFDLKGKIIAFSESESQSDCSNGDNACTSNTMEPKINRFPNSTSLLGRIGSQLLLGGQGKSKRVSHPPKPVPNSRQRLHLLHMDLCGPMRIASINGKRYVLVIMDDYSRYTWVHFLRSKDEAPDVIKTFLKRIIVLLQSPVIIIRTDNGTEFKNQALKEYFDNVGISHQMSSVQTPQQNGVVERRNWTLVEAARTVLIFSCAPLFLWAEAIATACFTQNRSIIHRRFNKTP